MSTKHPLVALFFTGFCLYAQAGYAAKAGDDLIYRTNIGRADDVKLLLVEKTSANDTNESGVPLLSLASARSDAESINIVKVLLESGADINKVDGRGQTPLFYAAKSGNSEVAEYLLNNGANYAAADKGGNTARNIAFQFGHNDIVELMDNFVRGKNDAIRKQYDEANRQLSERYKKYNEAIERETARQQESAKGATAAANESAAALSQMKEYVYDISYSSCALQYWLFCAQNKQPTELGAHGLAQNIDAQREKAVSLSTQFMQNYSIPKAVIGNIVNTSVGQIETELSTIKSNAARRAQGVGTIEDMSNRCSIIAGRWNVPQ